MPSINLATFKAKRLANSEGPRNLLQEKTANTMKAIKGDSIGLVGNPAAMFIDDLASAVTQMSSSSDDDLQRGLKTLGDMKDDLRDLSNGKRYQQLKQTAMDKGVSEADFFEMLHDLDKTYELDLKIENLDPAYPQEYRIKAGAKKKAVRAPKHVTGVVNSWASYADANKPQAYVEYTEEKKKEMLAKRMIGCWVDEFNQEHPQKALAYTSANAKKLSGTLQKSFGLRGLLSDIGALEVYANTDEASLASTMKSLHRPFKDLSFEDKKALIRRLQQGVREHMVGKDHRSTKYKTMYDSIMNCNVDALQDNANPKLNGEEQLMKMFESTIGYTKGKKSWRRKPDERCRFNQSLDLLGGFAEVSDGAKLIVKGVFDRINEVRRGKGQRTETRANYGLDKLKGDSYASLLEKEARKGAKKTAPKKTAQTIKTDAEAEEKKPAKKVAKPAGSKSGYTYRDWNAVNDNFLALENVPPYPKDGKSYGAPSFGITYKTTYWSKEEKISSGDAAEMIAATMALDKVNLYKNEHGELVLDNNAVSSEYMKNYMDQTIIRMGDKLQTPEQRKALFSNGEMSYENLDRAKLQEMYNEVKREVGGPAITL